MRVIDLAVARGDRRVLSALNFTVEPGEVLHLVGANGAGKTSLLEVLSGLRAPAEGRVEGQPEADALHWVGHRNALNTSLSPLENLGFWCRLSGVSGRGTAGALQRVGLQRLRHRPCGKLSTGQRRRVALARLLLSPRPWWFLDEPLAGLDAAGIELVCTLLNEHAAAGGAVVVSSHQPLAAVATRREWVLGA
ncbi:MAG: heme ABC exporter ATP-binding protein CcmA [Nevskiaceae bacterium]|nr:MAG: heme ABC exporter ATP-binding protein CcmA [Nevskiaceae bacterium]TBR74159.1 MAG: heme ABC exporter ATP-binding protein CcmA [Nevskiaceae bacterium]